MVEKNCEILNKYVQNILYGYSEREMDLTQLDEPFWKLGDSLRLLQKREHQLNLREEERRKNEGVDSAYNKILIQLTKQRGEWIMVVDQETKELLFCNKKQSEEGREEDFCTECRHRLSFKEQVKNWHSDETYAIWNAEDLDRNYYQVTSFQADWQGRKAYAHVVIDTTQEHREARQLVNMAYHDPGTGIANRRFFEEYMEKVLTEKLNVTLCYMDLDGLKYVNDRYGHLEGDEYLRSFVSIIKQYIRTTDVFARIGGDEFCLLFPGGLEDVAREKLEEILQQMVQQNRKEYPVSFSFGVIAIHQDDSVMSLPQILEKADEEMYLCKKQNKLRFHTKQRQE